MLPSCSPGVFRQKSFRSCTPPKVPVLPASASAVTPGSSPRNDSQGAPAAAANDRYAPRAQLTPTTSAPVESAVPTRDCGARTASLSSLSRGARAAAKHARLGPALASKMASASSSTVVQGWPNTKDDYELKEVIGEYRSPGQATQQLDERVGRSASCAPASIARLTGDAHLPTDPERQRVHG